MATEPPISPSRDQVVPLLVKQFVRDYQEAIKDFELPQKLELTEHLLYTIGLILLHARTESETVYEHFVELEDELLRKYRKTLRPYYVKQFFKYFCFDEVLIDKGIYSKEEFNRLAPEWKRLMLYEIEEFVSRCQDILFHTRAIIYLQMEPEAGIVEQKSTSALPELEEKDKKFTRARQLLAIYYLLKAECGIDHRESHSASAIARFAHLLLGKEITDIKNSDILKKYSRMPIRSGGKNLIADLKFILPFFKNLNMDKTVKLIEEEIQCTIREDIRPLDRKKYRGSDEP